MDAYDAAWVNARIDQTIAIWHSCASGPVDALPSYVPREQLKREQAYDHALTDVENDLDHPPATRAAAGNSVHQYAALFGRFAATALDLEGPAIDLLTEQFLPVGIELGRRARRFDPSLPIADVVQAARNAWTACGLQPLLGHPIGLTPAIFAYSMMYPYSDNLIDDAGVSSDTKREFSARFRSRLRGDSIHPQTDRERALWKLIELLEQQYPRLLFPNVFECLLAIHQAQENSLKQIGKTTTPGASEVLRLSCAKGGTSVLADACLARGSLTRDESVFAFEWGVLLQLGDDLQDVVDDIERGSATLFSMAALAGSPLDPLALQLLRFAGKVSERMDRLPHGDAVHKSLLKMSWSSLIIRSIADTHRFFSPSFVRQTQRHSPFRFHFLRQRSKRLASKQGLYAKLIQRMTTLDDDEDDGSQKNWPDSPASLASANSETSAAE